MDRANRSGSDTVNRNEQKQPDQVACPYKGFHRDNHVQDERLPGDTQKGRGAGWPHEQGVNGDTVVLVHGTSGVSDVEQAANPRNDLLIAEDQDNTDNKTPKLNPRDFAEPANHADRDKREAGDGGNNGKNVGREATRAASERRSGESENGKKCCESGARNCFKTPGGARLACGSCVLRYGFLVKSRCSEIGASGKSSSLRNATKVFRFGQRRGVFLALVNR